MSVDKAVEAVEEFLSDTFEDVTVMGEEWTADQADAIVELVLEATQPQGAVKDRDALVHAMQSIAGKANPSGEYCQAVARAALNNHAGGQ